MKTADQIASELAPDIAENNAAIGETDRRIVRLGDGQGNTRPTTLLTPRDVLYHGDQGINDQGTAILSATCPIPIQQIDGYWDTEVWLAKQPGSSQPMITGLVDVGGFSTGGPTPSEALANNASIPSQDRLLILRLRPADTGGLAVFVDAGVYAIAYEVGDGTQGYFSSQNFSLPDSTDGVVYHPTAAALTSSQHRLIGVALDPVSGQLIAIPGTAVAASGSLPSRSEFVEADYQAVDFTGYCPSGFLYSYYGQTDFVEDDCLRLFDPRLFLKKMQVVGSGTVTEVDTATGLTGGPITGTGSVALAGAAAAADNADLIRDSTQSDGVRWRPPLWAVAYNDQFSGGTYSIGFGLSSDQRRWSRKVEPAISAGSGFESSLVKTPYLVVAAGLIYCYYDGYDGSVFKIGLAISYDGGLTFTKSASNPVLTTSQGWENSGGANQVFFASVLYDLSETDGTKRWKMWYAGGSNGAGGIGYAYSSDGISWTKYASNPVLTVGSGWESTYILPGGVVKLGGTYYLFYNGNNGSGTWEAGLVTFTDPMGTYTRSASNPLLTSDGITSTLSGNVTAGDTTLHVTSATVFPIGAAVHVYDGSHHYITHVTARTDSTHIVVADAAPLGISSSGGNVRSVAYNSVNIHSAVYDGGWQFGLVGFQPLDGSGNLRELSLLGYADDDLKAVRIDYSAGLILRPTLAESQNTNLSLENPGIVALMDAPRRFLSPPTGGTDIDYYQTVQVNGTPMTQRSKLDLIAGTNVTLTPVDDSGGDRSKVTIDATGGGGGGWTQCCRVYNSADISIGSSVFTALTFDTEVYDTDTMHSTVTNTGRITLTTAGYYHIHAQVDWDVPSGNLNLQLQIRLNGTTVLANISHTANDTSSYQRMEISTDYQFSAADYVELLVSQNSGGSFAVKHQADNHSPAFMAHRFA